MSEVVACGEGVRVLLAQDAGAVLEELLVAADRLVDVASLLVCVSEVNPRTEGFRMILA